MKNLEQFITEVKRSKKRAEKLLSYLNKRSGFEDSLLSKQIPNIAHAKKFKPSGYGVGALHAMGKYTEDDKETPKKASLETVPMHKIAHSQYEVGVKNVRDKLRKNDNRPPHFIYDNQKDIYHIGDGNHRVAAAKLRGEKDITGHVWK